MKIDYSFLTNKIYVLDGKRKVDMTDEIVTSVQIMLHNKIEFNKISTTNKPSVNSNGFNISDIINEI